MRFFCFLLLLIILALHWATPRTAAPLHLPPLAVVMTRNPKIGVHTRLTGMGDEAAFRQQFTAIREMGASWVVDLFPWAYVQPRDPAVFDWRGADMLVAHARQQGLQVIARLDIVPAWARPHNTSDRLLLPAAYPAYARYVAAFATRYPDIQYLQIWNEPNLDLEWGGQTPDPEAYARLLQTVYPVVKQANPRALIVAGALSPGPDVPQARLDDLAYTRRVAQAGGQWDVWAVHAYGAKSPALEPPHPDRINFRRVEVYRELLRALEKPSPLIVTEGGWNDHPRWAGAVTPAQRLEWTVDAYHLARAWPDVVAVCLWQWQLPTTHSYQDNYSFVAPDGTPKALYWAVQSYALTDGD